jgi:hypothetical protein
MLFWFVATAIWSVWFVFRDPKFDYRLVAIAALIPDLIDGLRGSVGPLHSVVTSIAVCLQRRGENQVASGCLPYRLACLSI